MKKNKITMHDDNFLALHAENGRFHLWLKREIAELRDKLASQKRELESWTKAPMLDPTKPAFVRTYGRDGELLVPIATTEKAGNNQWYTRHFVGKVLPVAKILIVQDDRIFLNLEFEV